MRDINLGDMKVRGKTVLIRILKEGCTNPGCNVSWEIILDTLAVSTLGSPVWW
jgi:hypothetical protein